MRRARVRAVANVAYPPGGKWCVILRRPLCPQVCSIPWESMASERLRLRPERSRGGTGGAGGAWLLAATLAALAAGVAAVPALPGAFRGLRRDTAPYKGFSGVRLKGDSARKVFFHDQTIAVVEVSMDYNDMSLHNCELIEVK